VARPFHHHPAHDSSRLGKRLSLLAMQLPAHGVTLPPNRDATGAQQAHLLPGNRQRRRTGSTTMHRRAFVLSAPALIATRMAAAQVPAWPSRTIRIVLGFSAGTTSDLLARLVAQRLSDRMQTTFVVENREGAGGTIAAGMAARAGADGYTLLIGSTALTIAPRLFRQVSFRPLEDFEPIGIIGFAPNVIVVGRSVPIASIAELISAAKRAPGRLRYASSGPGSGSWIGMEQLKVLADIDLEEVPYSSTAQATTDAISGQIELHFPSLAGAMTHLRSGLLRPLGVTSGRRSPGAPDIPAIAETVPGYDTSTWYGLLAPSGLPEPVATRLSTELQAVLADPGVQATLRAAGVDAQPGSSNALGKIMAEATRTGNALMDRIQFRPQ
jgi:tripartite-type tricarboxylate transporter receptor subunit TctC